MFRSIIIAAALAAATPLSAGSIEAILYETDSGGTIKTVLSYAGTVHEGGLVYDYDATGVVATLNPADAMFGAASGDRKIYQAAVTGTGFGADILSGTPLVDGDTFGLIMGALPRVVLDDDYVWGSFLNGGAYFEGKSLADLGAVAGVYEYTFGQNTARLTVRAPTPSAVPLPAGVVLALTGLAGLGALRRRR